MGAGSSKPEGSTGSKHVFTRYALHASLISIASLSDCIVAGITAIPSSIQYSNAPLRADRVHATKKNKKQKALLHPNIKNNPLTSQSNSNAPVQFSSNLVEALQTNTEVRLRTQEPQPNTLAMETPIALQARPQLTI
jgi:hypothetical protein